jgi:hypothetical protein
MLRQIREERDQSNLGRADEGFLDTSVLVPVFYGDHVHH